jgi:riboflavin biosynthesis pyrimidine reductase
MSGLVGGAMQPMTLLHEDPPAPAGSLPAALAERYGGGLELGQDLVYGNLVASLDGVVSLGPGPGSPSRISGRNEGDRFLLGLLRALADCVLLGAGTVRAAPGHAWTAAAVDPEYAPLYDLLGRPPARVVVVTATGDLDLSRPPLTGNALVLTSRAGAARLRGSGVTTEVLGQPPFSGQAVLDAVRAHGHHRVLVEAGPHLMATLVAAQLVDELFLTVSPVIAGRQQGDGRSGVVEGLHLLPGQPRWATLRSARAHGSHLLLRYAL